MESSVPNETKAIAPRPLSKVRQWFLPMIEFVQFYGAFFLFGGGGILFTITSAILYPILPREFGARFGRTMMSRLFRFYLWMTTNLGTFKVDLSELDALRDERGLVIAANHPGLLDAVLLISRLPNVACIMKAEIWDNIFLGGGSRLAGYIRNDDPVNMVRLAAAELERGQQLLVFPEGTRTRKKPVNSFKGGFALIAKRAGAPIQTVIIETDNPCLSKGWPLFKKPVLPVAFKVRLGERFEVSDDVHAFVAKLEDYFHRALPPVK
jgi:1-acyl-sn-glycerol-3-phosphate acyltransferase